MKPLHQGDTAMVDTDVAKHAVAAADPSAHAAGSSTELNSIDVRLHAVEQLIKIFHLERIIHLSISIVSFIMLVSMAVFIFVKNGEQGQKYVFSALFLAPSGVLIYMSAAFLKMWTQALQVLNEKKE
jgi:hypothetical protein